MLKLSSILGDMFWIFKTFWLLHCFFGVLCLFGPLLASHTSPYQQTQQGNLALSLFCGIFLVPILCLPTKYLPILANLKWLYLAAPLSLGFSVYFTWTIFHFAPTPGIKLYLSLKETKTHEGLTITFSRIDSSPPGKNYKVGTFELKTAQQKGLITLDPYRYDVWEGYTLSLGKIFDDQSAQIWVRKESQ